MTAKKTGFLLFCAAALTALAALALIDPAGGLAGKVPLCPLHAITGLHCAGCGTTRALHELLRGNVLQSLAYNPLALVLAPFALYFLCAWGLWSFDAPRLPTPKFTLRALILLILALTLFGVVRNIPSFSFLAPHKIETPSEKP